MEWYRYNPDTLEYEHPVTCQPNPARPGEFLIPPSATELEPPSAEEHEIAVFQPDSNQWTIQPDYRGTEYWLPDGSDHKIEQIGEVPPKNALDKQPPPPPLTLEERFQEMKLQRERVLNDSDFLVLRHQDQVNLGIPTDITDNEFRDILLWRQELRDMTKTTKCKGKSSMTVFWLWPTIPEVIADIFPQYPPIDDKNFIS